MSKYDALTPDPVDYYQVIYSRRLTDYEIEAKRVTIRMDPYRIAGIHCIGGGPREHILKKVLRGSSKGHSQKLMYAEVIKCASRALEILEEDEV